MNVIKILNFTTKMPTCIVQKSTVHGKTKVTKLKLKIKIIYLPYILYTLRDLIKFDTF